MGLRSTLGRLFWHPQFTAVQLGFDEPLVSHDAPGVLLRIRPYKGNDGIPDGHQMLQSLHDVPTDFFGRNQADAHTFEVWYHDSKVTFYLHAATPKAAETFQARVQNTYPNTEVYEVEGTSRLPPIRPHDYVAGAWLELEKMPYYPIRHYQGEGFEQDPYGEITSEMVSTTETRVVTQVVFRGAKPGWADGSVFGRDSVDALAEGMRKGTSVGWLNPRVRPATEKDKQAAEIIEKQRGKQGFHVNIRVLAMSPDQHEACVRAEGVASMFGKYYNSITEQGLRPIPVAPSLFDRPRPKMRAHVERFQDRAWIDRDMILTAEELAGVAHIPNKSINTPAVDWTKMVAGAGVPADAPQAEDVIVPETDTDQGEEYTRSINRGSPSGIETAPEPEAEGKEEEER